MSEIKEKCKGNEENEENEIYEDDEEDEKYEQDKDDDHINEETKELPFVSLLTPTFNRRRYIHLTARCIELQDYPIDRMEWIIVNDGDEEIEDILNNLKKTKKLPTIKYYRYTEKMIIGAKRNICNYYASGDILINIDDDDYYPPERVSNSVNTLLKNSRVLCVGISKQYTHFKNYNKIGFFHPVSNNHACCGSLAFRKELLNITSYDNECKSVEDKKFLLDYKLPIIHLDPLKTILVNSHQNNLSRKKDLFFWLDKHIHVTDMKVEDIIKDKETYDYFMQDIENNLETNINLTLNNE